MSCRTVTYFSVNSQTEKVVDFDSVLSCSLDLLVLLSGQVHASAVTVHGFSPGSNTRSLSK